MAMTNKGYVMPMWSFKNADTAQAAIAQAKATGANSVNIDFALTTGPEMYSSSTVSKGGTSISALTTVLDIAKQQGMDVWLKPVLQVGTPDAAGSHVNWGALKPNDPAAWFQSYTQQLKDLGTVAQQHGVSHFILTNELTSMTTNPAYAGEWAKLIQEVRTVFKGPVGFNSGAFWGSGGSEYQSVPASVVANLDFMGLSAYPRVNKEAATTSVAQAEAGWSSDIYGRNDIAHIKAWANTYPTKPLYLTELGSPAISGGYYNINRGAQNDYQDQANYLLGSLKALKQAPEVKGVFVYEWSLAPAQGNYFWDVDQSPVVTSALAQGWNFV